jgi:Helicase
MGKRNKQLMRTQFPLSLAWAVTIHRVQGLSLDRAVMDLGNSIFESGQAYVALSRVRSLQGVALLGLQRESLQKVSEAVLQEYERLGIPVAGRSEGSRSTGPPAGQGETGANGTDHGTALGAGDDPEHVATPSMEDAMGRESLLASLGFVSAAAAAAAGVVFASLDHGAGPEEDQHGEDQHGEQGQTDELHEDMDTDEHLSEEDGGGLTLYRRLMDYNRSPLPVRLPEQGGVGRMRDWYGHDMTMWPPSNIWRNGGPTTLSWMYMPLIMDALGYPLVFPFERPDGWADLVAPLAEAFREHGVSLGLPDLSANWDSPQHDHLMAPYQEYLVNLDVEVAQAATALAYQLASASRQ